MSLENYVIMLSEINFSYFKKGEIVMKIAINVLNGMPEIFESIQGEGRNRGQKCIFIRLKGCNLHCSWCDTKDSWDNTDSLNEGVCFLSIPEIKHLFENYESKHVVITGGEPLLQQEGLKELIGVLSDYYIEVETNGTILPVIEVNQFNVSPKLGHSGNSRDIRENPEVLKELAKKQNVDFKFVVKTESDIARICDFVRNYGIRKEKVFLMALGKTVEELQLREKMVEEFADMYGFSFTDRLHVKLYGNRRGV